MTIPLTQSPSAEARQPGQTFAGGARFHQGILEWEGVRWLVYPSQEETLRYHAGDLECIQLRPRSYEKPRIFGDQLLFARRKFYRDPVVRWTDQAPPDSLLAYLQSEKFRDAVRIEDRMGTDVRAALERIEGELKVDHDRAKQSDIPPELWGQVKELCKIMSPEDIATRLSTPERVIKTSAVERLRRRQIRLGNWERQEVDLRNQVAADLEDQEVKWEKGRHLLELADEAVIEHRLADAQELRKNARQHFDGAMFLQKRIAAADHKLVEVQYGKQNEERKETQDLLELMQRRIIELVIKTEELTEELDKLRGEKTAAPPQAAEAEVAPAQQTPAEREEVSAEHLRSEVASGDSPVYEEISASGSRSSKPPG